jgi:PAS domain S-box-containing protein
LDQRDKLFQIEMENLSRSAMDEVQRSAAADSNDARYRMLVDAITDYAIYMLDPDGYVTNWNAGAQRFKGYRPEEIIGRHFSQFYTEEDRANGLPARALVTAAVEGMFEAEGWRLRKDGSRFWAHVVIDPIRDEDGTVLGYAKITRDLTERREAELRLRRTQEQFRLLVQGVTDYAIFMLDLDGNVSSWNAGAQRIKGYAPDEILGAHFSRFYTDEDRERGEPGRALETARRCGRFSAEGWRVRKDGTRFRASVVIDAIHDEAGVHIGFAKITRDITERETAQQELEKAREALFQSQKLEAIGQLTGGIAHDFNNLLMAILSSLDLLRKRMPQEPALLRLLDNAAQGAERGAALTQRMLAFARRQDLRAEKVEIPLLVHGMTDLLQRSLGPSLAIETRFPLNLPPVMADQNQLEMALLNLTINARDAMPNGGSITIAAQARTADQYEIPGLAAGSYVAIGVIDSGIGMDAATIARATDPFFTTKGVGKGTGLGLSMVHGLATQLNGTFRLKSTLGLGTTAELWLPVAGGKEKNAQLKAAEFATAPEPAAPPRSHTILAVDDDSLVLMNTVALLEDMGHRVIQAESGVEALEQLDQCEDIDLVITDQAMPDMTGAELADRIVQNRPDLRVILATGYGELPGDAHAIAFRLGKPFGQAQLAQAIGEVTA